MKKVKLVQWVSYAALMLGIYSCGSSAGPGEGPPFSSLKPAPTATDVWFAISASPYNPSDAISGDINCQTSGTITVDDSIAGNTETRKLTYNHCVYDVDFASSNQIVSVEANGDAQLTLVSKDASQSDAESGSLEQHVSFSKGLGFSANCSYSADSSLHYTGTCTYEDSAGTTLSIDGDQMTQAIQSLFASD